MTAGIKRRSEQMKAIYRKELGQLFHSMTGYICLAVFALLGGCFFVIYNLLQGNGDIRNYFSPMMSTVIFIIPVLTMRLSLIHI